MCDKLDKFTGYWIDIRLFSRRDSLLSFRWLAGCCCAASGDDDETGGSKRREAKQFDADGDDGGVDDGEKLRFLLLLQPPPLKASSLLLLLLALLPPLSLVRAAARANKLPPSRWPGESESRRSHTAIPQFERSAERRQLFSLHSQGDRLFSLARSLFLGRRRSCSNQCIQTVWICVISS